MYEPEAWMILDSKSLLSGVVIKNRGPGIFPSY